MVAIGIEINNADSCGIVNTIQFSTATLSVYADASLTIPKTQFAASDIAYFGATIQSTNATLTGFSLNSVCFSLNNGPCQTVVATNMAPIAGKNPVFAVNLAQTRYFTTQTSLQTFSVSATVGVTWNGGKRDVSVGRVNVDSMISVEASQDMTDDQVFSATSLVKVSVFAFVMLFIVFL